MNNVDLIISSEIQSYLKKENTFEENIKIAMKQAKQHWLVTEPDPQFRGAVGALGIFYGEGSEEFERIKQEMKFLNSLSVPQGVPVDFLALLDGMDNDLKPCGLRKIWDEV